MHRQGIIAQAVIVDNGRILLLNQASTNGERACLKLPAITVQCNENIDELLVGEVLESIGLRIKLLPVRVERTINQGEAAFKTITFLAHPISGSSKASMSFQSQRNINIHLDPLIWQDFYDDCNLSEEILSCVEAMRQEIDSSSFIKRAGALIYKFMNGELYYLLISSLAFRDRFMMPQGHVERGESSQDAAYREAVEEAGALIEVKKRLGFFLHESHNRCYKTDIFLAEYREGCQAEEDRITEWFTYKDIGSLNLHNDTKRLIERVNLQGQNIKELFD